MLSDDLLLHLQRDLALRDHWTIAGTHYARTADAWLVRMDEHKPMIERVPAQTYGAHRVTAWWSNWRVFFLACAELWGYRSGREWLVSHYVFDKRASSER
jgi:cyclopropane-fatty-acyl-phospholipid synthase